MTYEEIRELPVLDSVIRETLRIHPPIHSILRKVRHDIPVPATLSAPSQDSVYVVPAGYYVLACPAVSQADPRIWKNPNKFDTTRWSDPEGVAAEAYKKYTDEGGEKIDYGFGAVSKGTESPYQPFGAGRHRCIGEQVRFTVYNTSLYTEHRWEFAYLQLGVVLTTIIRRVEVRLETGKIPEHNYHVSVSLP